MTKRQFLKWGSRAALLALALSALLAISARSDDTLFALGRVSIKIPLADSRAAYLYDVKEGRALLGIETSLVEYRRVVLSGGAVTDLDGEGTPFLGLDTLLDRKFTAHDVRLGVWGGFDFKRDEWRGGLKGSTALWGGE